MSEFRYICMLQVRRNLERLGDRLDFLWHHDLCLPCVKYCIYKLDTKESRIESNGFFRVSSNGDFRGNLAPKTPQKKKKNEEVYMELWKRRVSYSR